MSGSANAGGSGTLPLAMDLSQHLNAKSKARHPSPLKDIIKFMAYDGMISLSGGKVSLSRPVSLEYLSKESMHNQVFLTRRFFHSGKPVWWLLIRCPRPLPFLGWRHKPSISTTALRHHWQSSCSMVSPFYLLLS